MSGMDGLNALPDEVLHLILSYLPTKEAVRAQLISKRWKNMWAYLPVLDFDFADFWSEDIFIRGGQTYVKEHSDCHEKFVRAIDAVLASRQIQKIDRFRLVWEYQVKTYSYDHHPVRRWILLVLQQSPKVLSIYVQPCDVRVYVPDEAFICTSLEEVKLQVDNIVWPEVLEPAPVNLPSLRRLNLGYYTIKGDFMNTLLLGCPNLEELELYACRLNLSKISCDSLKCLVIDGCCNSTDILVSIPSLQNLKVTVMSCQTAGIIFENMSSLLKACVCFLTAHEHLPKALYKSEAKTLNGLSVVTKLDVLLHGSEAGGMLRHALANGPEFDNLETLHVESFDGCLVDCMDVIERLIQHSSTLEDLTFYRCEDTSDEFELLEELKMTVGEEGNCWVSECNEGSMYDSLDILNKQLLQYMNRFAKMQNEVTAEEYEEALLEEEDVEEEEEDWEEEDEEEDGEQGEADVAD